MTGYERERVETLLRERAAGMTRTPTVPPLHPDFPASATPLKLDPTVEPVRVRESVSVPDPDAIIEVALRGSCVDCGDRISAARLKALPDSERCVSCQRELEARER